MQGIHTHTPETNHVPREYTVAVILSLLFIVPPSLVPSLASLCYYVSTFRCMCAVPNLAVFCSSLTSWFLGMLHMYFIIIIIITTTTIIIIIAAAAATATTTTTTTTAMIT